MPRASHFGEPDPAPAGGEKDPYRGIDPDHFNRFSDRVDRQLVEMSALFVDDKPARKATAYRLLTQVRTLRLFVEKFEAEVEAAA